MEKTYSVPLLKLYGPLLLLCFLVLAFIKTGWSGHDVLLTLSPFGDFVDLHYKVTNASAVRAVIVAMALASMASYLIYDYSKFFPQNFVFDAFYDTEGIAEHLGNIAPAYLRGLIIPTDAEAQRQAWMAYLDGKLAASVPTAAPFFTSNDGILTSMGETRFKMDKGRGFQHYHIKVSEGSLETKLERSGEEPRFLFSKFKMIESKFDHVCVTLRDFFLLRGTVLRTIYSQSLIMGHTQGALPWAFIIYGITPLTIFPWPTIGKTVYLGVVDDKRGIVVPFGYAVYQ